MMKCNMLEDKNVFSAFSMFNPFRIVIVFRFLCSPSMHSNCCHLCFISYLSCFDDMLFVEIVADRFVATCSTDRTIALWYGDVNLNKCDRDR